MTVAISGWNGDLDAVLIAQAGVARRQVDSLTQQASSGLIGTTYAQLGTGAAEALRLSPIVSHLDAAQTAISGALGRMQTAQTALTEIGNIASSFFAQTNTLNGLNPAAVDSVAAAARDALKQMASLLDTQYGGIFVFAGSDSSNAPVPTPDGILSSGFYTQVGAAVAALDTNGAAATATATLNIAASNAAGTSPFSAALSQPATDLAQSVPTVSAGDARLIPTGIVASANETAVSHGTSTTGSYTRDILRALATLGALSSSQVSSAAFADVVADTRTSLGDAITALNVDAGVMGNRQAALQDQAALLSNVGDQVKARISNAQDVDMAATLSDLMAAQTRLQASYQLLAALPSLSLVKYLGA